MGSDNIFFFSISICLQCQLEFDLINGKLLPIKEACKVIEVDITFWFSNLENDNK